MEVTKLLLSVGVEYESVYVTASHTPADRRHTLHTTTTRTMLHLVRESGESKLLNKVDD